MNRHNDTKHLVRYDRMVHIVKRNVSVPLQSLGGKSQARLQVGMKPAKALISQINLKRSIHELTTSCPAW